MDRIALDKGEMQESAVRFDPTYIDGVGSLADLLTWAAILPWAILLSVGTAATVRLCLVHRGRRIACVCGIALLYGLVPFLQLLTYEALYRIFESPSLINGPSVPPGPAWITGLLSAVATFAFYRSHGVPKQQTELR